MKKKRGGVLSNVNMMVKKKDKREKMGLIIMEKEDKKKM